jgi:hypothetical protein
MRCTGEARPPGNEPRSHELDDAGREKVRRSGGADVIVAQAKVSLPMMLSDSTSRARDHPEKHLGCVSPAHPQTAIVVLTCIPCKAPTAWGRYGSADRARLQ